MSINKSENSLSDSLVNMITEHERMLRELKTGNQPIGADTLSVVWGGQDISVGPVTVPADAYTYVGFTTTPALPILTLYNFEITLYVDGNTHNDMFPNGSNLTTGARHATFINWLDWEDSNEGTGVRKVKVHVHNLDTVSHNYYLMYAAILPKMPLA